MRECLKLTAECPSCSLALFCVHHQAEMLVEQVRPQTVKKYRHILRHEALFLPNHKFQNLYVISHGVFKAYQIEADGKERIRGFYFPGEILGFEAIYTDSYRVTATALSEALVCEIPYEHFLESVQDKPGLQQRCLYLFSKQLNVGSYLAAATALQRLAAFLLDLSERLHSTEAGTQFIIPMSRQDIGNYLRLSGETISRLLSQMHKSKIIALKYKKIRILQAKRLQEMAAGC